MRKAPAEIEWDDNMGEGHQFHEAGWRALQTTGPRASQHEGIKKDEGGWPLKRKGERMVELMNKCGV
jgi:hypothetical protein